MTKIIEVREVGFVNQRVDEILVPKKRRHRPDPRPNGFGGRNRLSR
jgi:hypothetical protein